MLVDVDNNKVPGGWMAPGTACLYGKEMYYPFFAWNSFMNVTNSSTEAGSRAL